MEIETTQTETEAPVYRHPNAAASHSLLVYDEPLIPYMNLDCVRAAYDPTIKETRLYRWPDGTNMIVPPGATPDDLVQIYIAARMALMLKLAVPIGNA